MIELSFLDDFVIGGEHGEVAAAGTPGRVVGGDGFLGDFSRGGSATAVAAATAPAPEPSPFPIVDSFIKI